MQFYSSVRRASARGFSLVELLVVIFIIAVVVALLIPALGRVRDTGRKTDTLTLMNSVLQACELFQQDQRRTPGYFSPRDMGSPDNGTPSAAGRGMSAMENILLDLCGGITDFENRGRPGVVEVSPIRDSNSYVYVDTSLIGVSSTTNRVYFTPPAKNYIAQVRNVSQVGEPGHTDNPGDAQLPDLVDSFGQPILAWVADPAAPNAVATVDDFARLDSGLGANRLIARYYWASNACFLKSANLGKKGQNQTLFSTFGNPANSAQFARSMAGLLGNPNSPANPTATYDQMLPATGRGTITLHSAGVDGIYFKAGPSPVHYGLSLKDTNNQPRRDREGKAASIDNAIDYDDILIAGGN